MKKSTRLLLYRWPAPLAFLFFVVGLTNPIPHLFGTGALQQTIFFGAALAVLGATLRPRSLAWRQTGVLGVTVACGFRAVTLLDDWLVGSRYSPTETIAFVAVWVVIVVLYLQMVVLTWPTISLDSDKKP